MGPSNLINPSIIVIADTSAAINLNATGHAAQILSAFPNRLHMTDIAIAELAIDRRSGRQDAKLAAELNKNGLITTATLGTIGLSHFESLVVGPAKDTLDDGEASTIALSLEMNGYAVIDERKAIRICDERFANLPIGCTMDILAHDAVFEALGRQTLTDAIFGALQDARMRVLPHYIDWIIDLLGRDRAALCPNLARARNPLA